jgi:aminocarboxymuconate-semialdehyde decarboxylase
MPSRRQFLRTVSGAAAGAAFAVGGPAGVAARALQSTGATGRRSVMVGGRRVTTVDVHAHCFVDIGGAARGHEWAAMIKKQLAGPACAAAPCVGREGRGPEAVNAQRVRLMDQLGIDVQALSINPFWYSAERGLAQELMLAQNEGLAAACKAFPGRFVAFATVALQHPELAAEQLDHAVTKLGLRGANITGNIAGEELGARRFDPFWAKAQELKVPIFLHPQTQGRFDGNRYPVETNKRLQGSGNLSNVIGHPLETTIGLAKLIFDGTLDRFPGLRVCGAHGGGFIGSYTARADAGCIQARTGEGCEQLKKRPSEYFKDQIMCDSLIFNAAGLRHLVAQHGVNQIVLGTDFPAGWPTRGVDHILETAGLSDADKSAILGDTLVKLMRIETPGGNPTATA